MRVFSAIPLPIDIKNKVAGITRGRLPVPYVNTDNLLVTLNYFGELDTDHVKLLTEIFGQGLSKKQPIKIVFDKVVQFHSQLHLTLEPSPVLERVHDDMAKFFSSRGFHVHAQEYYPHVKLANLHMDKVMHRERRVENFPNEELSQLNFTAEKIVLYESKLLLHHPKYIPLVELKLF